MLSKIPPQKKTQHRVYEHISSKVKKKHKHRKLVGGFNPFEKYQSNWIISPIFGVKRKKYLSCHHLENLWLNILLAAKNRRCRHQRLEVQSHPWLWAQLLVQRLIGTETIGKHCKGWLLHSAWAGVGPGEMAEIHTQVTGGYFTPLSIWGVNPKMACWGFSY